jgi:hypothetical protein
VDVLDLHVSYPGLQIDFAAGARNPRSAGAANDLAYFIEPIEVRISAEVYVNVIPLSSTAIMA